MQKVSCEGTLFSIRLRVGCCNIIWFLNFNHVVETSTNVNEESFNVEKTLRNNIKSFKTFGTEREKDSKTLPKIKLILNVSARNSAISIDILHCIKT